MVNTSISKAGQMKITIPKLIAEALQLYHRTAIRFSFNGHEWELIKDDLNGTVRVFLSNNGQMKMTIPKLIVDAMQLKKNMKLTFVFNSRAWELRKEMEHGD